MGNRIHETHGKNKSLAIWISKDPPASELANFLSAKKFSLLLFVLFCGFLNPARMTEQEEVLEEVLLLTISEEEEPLGDDEEVKVLNSPAILPLHPPPPPPPPPLPPPISTGHVTNYGKPIFPPTPLTSVQIRLRSEPLRPSMMIC